MWIFGCRSSRVLNLLLVWWPFIWIPHQERLSENFKKRERSVQNGWQTKLLDRENTAPWKSIISTPSQAQKLCACRLCHVFVTEPNTFLFQLSKSTGKGIWKATILFLQFNYFFIHELDRNYGTIYNLAITWNAICVIGRIIQIYSLSDQTIPRS